MRSQWPNQELTRYEKQFVEFFPDDGNPLTSPTQKSNMLKREVNTIRTARFHKNNWLKFYNIA